MDYQRIYDEFIADRKAKEAALIASGEYKERHHIVPRSMGGSDDADNLVCLTAGDHFFAHLCLAKTYGGNQWAGVWSMAGAYRNKGRTNDKKWMIQQKKWVEKARYNGLILSQRGVSKPCTMSPEEITARSEKVANAKRGVPQPSVSGEKNGMAREVKCVDTGEIFATITEASEKFCVPITNIRKVAEGERFLAGNVAWVYTDKAKAGAAEKKREKLKNSNKKKKKILNVCTGVVFNTRTEAAKSAGVTDIAYALKTGSKSGGYRWAYV